MFLAASLKAQVNNVSPYSRFGLGEPYPEEFTRHLGFGGASMGLPDPINLNLSNPASYTSLQLTNFEAGFEGTFLTQSQSDPPQEINNNRSGMRYLAAGVPLTNWWGSAISLRPYTLKGYSISTSRRMASDTSVRINDRFSGEGGLSQVTWGNAFEVAKNFSVGVNANYIFGSLRERQVVDFEPVGFLDTRIHQESFITGLHFNFGFQYQYEWESGHFAGLGFAYSNAQQLNAEQSNFSFTSFGSQARDTLRESGVLESSVTLPSSYTAGLSFGRRDPNVLQAAWAINVDYEDRRGSEFRDANNNSGLIDSYRWQAGGFFTPRYAFRSMDRNTGYFSNIEYRFGGFYEQLPFSLGGINLYNYGFTMGLGLPIRQRNLAPGETKVSMLQIGLMAGRRGSLAQNLIREDYLSVFISVSFNDKWFLDYKYR